MSAIALRRFESVLVKLGLETYERIAVAVSGGPDSIALLYLLSKCLPSNHIYALTVDHALRSTSLTEAQGVAAYSASLGIAHAILPIPWSIPPFPAYPTPHSTESPARTARLILFREFMRNHRVNNLLVGHHLDDQVENKLTRGYGMGMRVCMDGREVDGEYGGKKWMMRPLLSFTKAETLTTCQTHSLPFIVDPTNFDPLHTPRNALRQTIASFQSRHLIHPHRISSSTTASPSREEGGPLALLRHSVRSDASRSSFSTTLPDLVHSGVIEIHTPVIGTITLHPARLSAALPSSEVIRRLKEIIHFVAIPGSSISNDALVRIYQSIFLPSLAEARGKFTLGAGVMFQRKGKEWIISRQGERRNQAGADVRISEGQWIEWDQRIWLRWSERREAVKMLTIKSSESWRTPLLMQGDQLVFDLEKQRKSGEDRGQWTSGEMVVDWRFSNSIY